MEDYCKVLCEMGHDDQCCHVHAWNGSNPYMVTGMFILNATCPDEGMYIIPHYNWTDILDMYYFLDIYYATSLAVSNKNTFFLNNL